MEAWRARKCFKESMWARPRSYFAYWRSDVSKNAYFGRGASLPCLLASRFCKKCLFCRGEALPCGPPHAGAILGPSCEGLTSAGGLFLEASSLGFSRGPTLLVMSRRKCFRSSFFGLWDAESASGVAPGGLGSPKVLQAQRLEACGLRKCFRSRIWMRWRG